MDSSYLCPDCRETHLEPGLAGLGHRIRCYDCQAELDLAFELSLIVVARPVAA